MGRRHRATTCTTSPKREAWAACRNWNHGTYFLWAPERHRLFSERRRHLTKNRPPPRKSFEIPHNALLVKNGRGAWGPHCVKGEGPKDPRCARSERRRGAVGFHKVVAATAGFRAGSFTLTLTLTLTRTLTLTCKAGFIGAGLLRAAHRQWPVQCWVSLSRWWPSLPPRPVLGSGMRKAGFPSDDALVLGSGMRKTGFAGDDVLISAVA